MNRKVTLLLIRLMGISICGAIVIHEFFPLYALQTSIGEINSNPSVWVNKMVVVEGKLVGPMISCPEATPPWNYDLFGSNETVETIGRKGAVIIGVLWNYEDGYSFENTRVVGVVREGRWLYLYGERPVCYYIEAKRIDRL